MRMPVIFTLQTLAKLYALSFALLLGPFLLGESAQPTQHNRIYQIDLPAGTLHEALLSLATTHKVSVIYATETVDGLSVPAIRGPLTLDELFARIKISISPDACLNFQHIRETLVALSPDCNSGRAFTAPHTASVAAENSTLPPQQIIEELTVRERYLTGSRLRNAAFGQSMPLDIIDQTEIRLSGYQAVGELLRYIPAVSGNSTSTLISNGGDGTATITLRGLPASNTLVLLNGRRLNVDALGGHSVDLNTLPLAMVEQIEILKDGASAIYGSDAVAGVVNVLTRQTVDGLNLDLYSGISGENDLKTNRMSLSYGHNGSRWSGVFGLNYYDQAGLRSTDRPVSESSDDRVRGGIDKRSSATVPARITLPSGPVILSDGADGAFVGDYRPATADDRFEYRDFTSSIVPSRRTSAFGNLTWQLSDEWQAYMETLFTQTEASSRLAPVPVFTPLAATPLTIDADHPFIPFGIELNDVRRRIIELPARMQLNDSTTYRGVFGVRRQINDANLDIALQYSQTRADERSINGINAFRLAESLSDNCDAPCVPVNLLGAAGSITPEMLAYIETAARIEGTSRMLALSVNSDWSMGSSDVGTIEVSSGFEYRRDELHTDPDAVLLAGALLSGGNRSTVSGHRDIFEAYTEVFFPLLKEHRWAYRLHTQVAARISHYSDFGWEINPRATFAWQPIRDLTVRGSAAGGFRAPTLLQLHGSEQQSFQQLNDPCTVASNVALLPGCTQQADPSLTQFLATTGGESELEAERSRTLTLGVLWQREWKGAAAAVSGDWYAIDQRDVVESSAQYILNQNARTGTFAGRIIRNSEGNLSRVLATLQNIGRRELYGYDLTGSAYYEWPDYGRLTMTINATHIESFRDKFDPDSAFVEKSGTFSDEASGGLGALPDWKWNLGLSWEQPHWHAFYNIYRVSSLSEVVPLRNTRRRIDHWVSHNFNLTYRGPLTAWTGVTFGVNNLLNEAPPFSASAFNDSYDARTYDLTGRYFYLRLARNFSSNQKKGPQMRP